jgi:acetyltransferase-like isoleucine patch superfamily enzyme
VEKEIRFKTNAARNWSSVRSPSKIIFNSCVITLLKYMPPFELKNTLYKRLLGIKIGKDVAISPDVIFDPFFPELIKIGDHCSIGWGARIFAHEFWLD